MHSGDMEIFCWFDDKQFGTENSFHTDKDASVKNQKTEAECMQFL